MRLDLFGAVRPERERRRLGRHLASVVEPHVTARSLRKLEASDRDTLRAFMEMDADGFFDGLSAELNQRQVCGLASMYTLLATTPARRANLYRYDQAVEQAGEMQHSVVTYASIVLT